MPKDSIHLFEEIANHMGIYLSKKGNIESVFLLKQELTVDTLFSIDVYKDSGDIYVDDLYLISSTREDN